MAGLTHSYYVEVQQATLTDATVLSTPTAATTKPVPEIRFSTSRVDSLWPGLILTTVLSAVIGTCLFSCGVAAGPAIAITLLLSLLSGIAARRDFLKARSVEIAFDSESLSQFKSGIRQWTLNWSDLVSVERSGRLAALLHSKNGHVFRLAVGINDARFSSENMWQLMRTMYRRLEASEYPRLQKLPRKKVRGPWPKYSALTASGAIVGLQTFVIAGAAWLALLQLPKDPGFAKHLNHKQEALLATYLRDAMLATSIGFYLFFICLCVTIWRKRHMQAEPLVAEQGANWGNSNSLYAQICPTDPSDIPGVYRYDQALFEKALAAFDRHLHFGRVGPWLFSAISALTLVGALLCIPEDIPQATAFLFIGILTAPAAWIIRKQYADLRPDRAKFLAGQDLVLRWSGSELFVGFSKMPVDFENCFRSGAAETLGTTRISLRFHEDNLLFDPRFMTIDPKSLASHARSPS